MTDVQWYDWGKDYVPYYYPSKKYEQISCRKTGTICTEIEEFDNQLDIVISSYIIEHCYKYERALWIKF